VLWIDCQTDCGVIDGLDQERNGAVGNVLLSGEWVIENYQPLESDTAYCRVNRWKWCTAGAILCSDRVYDKMVSTWELTHCHHELLDKFALVFKCRMFTTH